MEEKKEGYNYFFEQLGKAFYGFLALPLLVFIIFYVQMQANESKPIWDLGEEGKVVIRVLISTLVLIFLVLGYWTYKARLGRAVSGDIHYKLSVYKEARIRQYIFFSMICFFAIIGIKLMADPFYAILFMVGMLVFSVNKPTAYRFNKDMKLSKEERIPARGPGLLG